MMAHDLPYVAKQVEALGYAKAKDMHAWYTDIPVFPRRWKSGCAADGR